MKNRWNFQFALACVMAVASAAPGVIVSPHAAVPVAVHPVAVHAHPVAVAHSVHAHPVAISHSSS